MAQTLTQHIANVREFSNTQNNTGFVSDAEITKRLNEAVGELYDLVVVSFEHYYVSTQGPFTLAGGQSGYTQALPADFYKDVGLDRNPNTTSAVRVPKLPSFIERNRTLGPVYAITGNNLEVRPPDNSAGTYLLYYTPKAPVLVNPGDTLDVTLSNWEEFIDIRAAIKVLTKREMDTTSLQQDLAMLTERIKAMAANRSEEPSQVPLADSVGNNWWNQGEGR